MVHIRTDEPLSYTPRPHSTAAPPGRGRMPLTSVYPYDSAHNSHEQFAMHGYLFLILMTGSC